MFAVFFFLFPPLFRAMQEELRKNWGVEVRTHILAQHCPKTSSPVVYIEYHAKLEKSIKDMRVDGAKNS